MIIVCIVMFCEFIALILFVHEFDTHVVSLSMVHVYPETNKATKARNGTTIKKVRFTEIQLNTKSHDSNQAVASANAIRIDDHTTINQHVMLHASCFVTRSHTTLHTAQYAAFFIRHFSS